MSYIFKKYTHLLVTSQRKVSDLVLHTDSDWWLLEQTEYGNILKNRLTWSFKCYNLHTFILFVLFFYIKCTSLYRTCKLYAFSNVSCLRIYCIYITYIYILYTYNIYLYTTLHLCIFKYFKKIYEQKKYFRLLDMGIIPNTYYLTSAMRT